MFPLPGLPFHLSIIYHSHSSGLTSGVIPSGLLRTTYPRDPLDTPNHSPTPLTCFAFSHFYRLKFLIFLMLLYIFLSCAPPPPQECPLEHLVCRVQVLYLLPRTSIVGPQTSVCINITQRGIKEDFSVLPKVSDGVILRLGLRIQFFNMFLSNACVRNS